MEESELTRTIKFALKNEYGVPAKLLNEELAQIKAAFEQTKDLAVQIRDQMFNSVLENPDPPHVAKFMVLTDPKWEQAILDGLQLHFTELGYATELSDTRTDGGYTFTVTAEVPVQEPEEEPHPAPEEPEIEGEEE